MEKVELLDPSWEKISEEKLSEHILKGHLNNSYTLKKFGVPLYDIQLAEYRKFSLQKVINEISRLIPSNLDFLKLNSYNNYSTGEIIFKTLIYIEELDLGKFDKNIFQKIINSEKIIYENIYRMSPDFGFYITNEKDLSPYENFIRNVLENPFKINKVNKNE